MQEATIRDFWNAHPCGEGLIGSTTERIADYEAFFRDYDTYRYRTEGHILQCLDAIRFAGKRTLEIGLGQGADSEQIIRRGGRWSGLDLTPESVQRVRLRLQLRGLPYEDLKQGSVLEIPYDTGSFDILYSHGVLHHVPDIRRAQSEIHRVLRPAGVLVVMLYARWSLNYLIAIGLVRRLGLPLLQLASPPRESIYGQHLANARELGLLNYLSMKNFIHRNTDGPLNPYSKVYDLGRVRADFPSFRIERAYKRFMHAPPLPVRGLPFAGLLGWHLWVHLRPMARSARA